MVEGEKRGVSTDVDTAKVLPLGSTPRSIAGKGRRRLERIADLEARLRELERWDETFNARQEEIYSTFAAMPPDEAAVAVLGELLDLSGLGPEEFARRFRAATGLRHFTRELLDAYVQGSSSFPAPWLIAAARIAGPRSIYALAGMA